MPEPEFSDRLNKKAESTDQKALNEKFFQDAIGQVDKLTPTALGKVQTSDLLSQPGNKPLVSVETKQGTANLIGTVSAGFGGAMDWAIVDKIMGNSRYAIPAKLVSAYLVGGISKVATKGAAEAIMLDPVHRTTSAKDFTWGGVDALATIGAIKAENTFSDYWKASLGKSSGLHLTNEMMVEQGGKMIEGSLRQKITFSTIRGVVGGGTGAFLVSTPHAFAENSDKLNTMAGWKRTTDKIFGSVIAGSTFGGVLTGGSSALWNIRPIVEASKASFFGKQGRYELDILHFNDGHSSILGDRSTLPQLAGKATELRSAADKKGLSSLVLDMGDAHSGNASAVVSNTGEIEQRLIHQALKVDASIPGNHSADVGIGSAKSVNQWIKNMNDINAELATSGREVPGLAANVQSVLDPKFVSADGIYKPYRTFVDPKTGDKVGLVGLVTDTLQGAAPKLIDADLAIAARKLGNLSLPELEATAASNPQAASLIAQLQKNATVKSLMQAQPSSKVSSLVDRLLDDTALKSLGADARANYKAWFELAGEHPQATLAELAKANGSNPAVAQLAKLYPDKQIGDLKQIMVSDPLEALESSVAALKAEGVDKVIVMSHMGKAADLQLAQQGPRVAAIFGGHSHHLEPVPLFVKNAQTGSDVMVSQAGHSYGWLGEAKLVFNTDGSINRYLSSGKMHVIDEKVVPLAAAKDQLMSYLDASDAGRRLLQQVQIKHPITVATEMPLDNIRGQMGTQTPLANLLVKAYKEGANLLSPAQEVDAVLIQSGGIRAGLPAGKVDEQTLTTMFMNAPAVVEMNGAQIQKALSYGVHDFPAAQKPSGITGSIKSFFDALGRKNPPLSEYDASGKFIVAGEIRFTVDRSRPTWDRAQSVEIFDKALGKHVPIDQSKTYKVMTVGHLIDRFANTPLIPASELRNVSAKSLGPEYWVLGREMTGAEATAQMNASIFSVGKSKEMLLNYLSKNSSNGLFVPPPGLFLSPMKDESPGTWVPSIRTSPSMVPVGVTSAQMSTEVKD